MSVTIEILLRRLILALLTFGLVAITGELVALGHYKESWQIVPIACQVTGVLVIVWHVITDSAASLKVLRLLMLVMFVVGLTGVLLHFRWNRSFQLDANPDLAGWALIAKILHAKSPPTLAPGAMVQLALLGLIYGYKHPLLRK